MRTDVWRPFAKSAGFHSLIQPIERFPGCTSINDSCRFATTSVLQPCNWHSNCFSQGQVKFNDLTYGVLGRNKEEAL
jgi:hypothetical protein